MYSFEIVHIFGCKRIRPYQLDVAREILELFSMHGQQFLLFLVLLHGCNFTLLDELFRVILVFLSEATFFLGFIAQGLIAGDFLCRFHSNSSLPGLQVLVLPVQMKQGGHVSNKKKANNQTLG